MLDRDPLLRKRKKNALHRYGPDYVTLMIAGGMALGFYLMPPLPNRLFLVKDPATGTLENLEDSLPIRPEIIPMWLSGAISAIAGFTVIGFAQIWVRSTKDFHRGVLGLLTSLVAASWFQVICKILIGGFRPNFLSICQPDLTRAQGQGYGELYYDKSVCTGDKAQILDALESFPSGHSCCAFAGLLYVSIYLNAKTKLWGSTYPRVWKLFLVFTPTLAATILSLTRLLDYTHHWYDILAGSIIGIVFALAAYRMQYRSIFNPENNHQLLPKKGKNLTLTFSPSTYREAHHQVQGDPNA